MMTRRMGGARRHVWHSPEWILPRPHLSIPFLPWQQDRKRRRKGEGRILSRRDLKRRGGGGAGGGKGLGGSGGFFSGLL